MDNRRAKTIFSCLYQTVSFKERYRRLITIYHEQFWEVVAMENKGLNMSAAAN